MLHLHLRFCRAFWKAFFALNSLPESHIYTTAKSALKVVDLKNAK
jgi:hypothetical protein